MDTPYTQGFKAGMVWETERIVKLLESSLEDCSNGTCDRCDERAGLKVAIKLIKEKINDQV